jgi:AbrB family looped-hinge helix DNA binding protein
METTKLSSKGQVIIPKAFRSRHRWAAGLELVVLETKDGVLLKPKPAFEPTLLSDVIGALKGKVTPKTDFEIEEALEQDIRARWHGRG